MNRTLRPRLLPTPEQAVLLIRTARSFMDAFNLVGAMVWQIEQDEDNAQSTSDA